MDKIMKVLMHQTPIFDAIVYTDPVPLARPRVVGKRAFTPKRSKDAKTFLRFVCGSKYKGKIHEDALGITLRFVHKRPKRIKVDHRVPKSTTPDTDNLLKLLLDSLEGLIFKNDGQFCKFDIEDWYADKNEQPHIHIVISTITTEPQTQ